MDEVEFCFLLETRLDFEKARAEAERDARRSGSGGV